MLSTVTMTGGWGPRLTTSLAASRLPEPMWELPTDLAWGLAGVVGVVVQTVMSARQPHRVLLRRAVAATSLAGLWWATGWWALLWYFLVTMIIGLPVRRLIYVLGVSLHPDSRDSDAWQRMVTIECYGRSAERTDLHGAAYTARPGYRALVWLVFVLIPGTVSLGVWYGQRRDDIVPWAIAGAALTVLALQFFSILNQAALLRALEED